MNTPFRTPNKIGPSQAGDGRFCEGFLVTQGGSRRTRAQGLEHEPAPRSSGARAVAEGRAGRRHGACEHGEAPLRFCPVGEEFVTLGIESATFGAGAEEG